MNKDGLWFIVFNTTFNNILVITGLSVLLVEENKLALSAHLSHSCETG
jgi:hypothetical protein